MNDNIDNKAIFSLSYGLFVLTARDGEKDNGCIINTCIQVANNPTRIAIAVNKDGLTHDMVLKTKLFNVSVIDESAKMDIFSHFGFQSGKSVDKFASNEFEAQRSENGVYYINNSCNAYISAYVTNVVDLGSHTLFIASVVKAVNLSDTPSVTYTYYSKNIKPAPQKKKGWICKVCGYVYEGEVLPDDFICPVCKHPASDFERIV